MYHKLGEAGGGREVSQEGGEVVVKDTAQMMEEEVKEEKEEEEEEEGASPGVSSSVQGMRRKKKDASLMALFIAVVSLTHFLSPDCPLIVRKWTDLQGQGEHRPLSMRGGSSHWLCGADRM